MSTINNLVTAADLADQQGDGYRCELIRGEVVRMSPTGGKHGIIAHRIGRLLGNWAEQQGIGLVFAAKPDSNWRPIPTPCARLMSPSC